MPIEISFRLPDFLHTAHSYDGEPKILCEIIGDRISANSTDQLYVHEHIFFSSFFRGNQVFSFVFQNTFRCNINNKNIEPFQLIFLAGVFFMFTATVASYCLDTIPPKILICKFLPGTLQPNEI